jgi:hypothetical protein
VVRPHRSRTVVPQSPAGIWRASCAQAAGGRRRAFTGSTPATSASRLACSTSAPRPCPYRFAPAFGFRVARCEVRGIDRHRPDGEQPNDTWESPKSSIFHWAKPGGHQKEVGACARVRTDRYAHFRRLRESTDCRDVPADDPRLWLDLWRWAAINVVTALTLDEFREEAFLVGYIQGTRHPSPSLCVGRPAPVGPFVRSGRSVRYEFSRRRTLCTCLAGPSRLPSHSASLPPSAYASSAHVACSPASVGADFRAVCAGAQAAGTDLRRLIGAGPARADGTVRNVRRQVRPSGCPPSFRAPLPRSSLPEGARSDRPLYFRPHVPRATGVRAPRGQRAIDGGVCRQGCLRNIRAGGRSRCSHRVWDPTLTGSEYLRASQPVPVESCA